MEYSPQLLAEALEALPVNVAVLDSDGTIQQTNRSWQAFGTENDIQIDPDTVGTNYLSVCEQAGTDTALAVKQGLSELLAGRRETFEQIYPCHSPVEQRWFLLQAVPLTVGDERYSVVAHVNVTQQLLAERRLQAQRDALAALDDLNTALRAITHRVLKAPPQPEIETAVCETLVETGHYSRVEIGSVEGRSASLDLRASAGDCQLVDTESANAESTNAESTDAESANSAQSNSESTDGERIFGATAIREAIWSRSLQTTTTMVDNAAFDWRTDRDHPAENLALAAVPISHEGTIYGLCLLYTDRPNAFDSDEREILSQLGALVGHAVDASERRQALMSDALIEIELRLPDYIPQPTPPDDWSVEITHTVDAPEGGSIMYGTVAAADRPAVERVFEPLSGFGFSVLGQQGETFRIQLRTDQRCLTARLAAHGWSTESVTLANGDAYLTVRLPAGDSVREVVETVAERAPDVELLARRQRHATLPGDHSQPSPVDELTDRQRTVLETAHAAGYFQWPRDSSGEELADTLGIAPPTFHQHLRIGQQKLMDALFDSQSSTAQKT